MYDIVLVDVTYSETQLAKDSSRFVFVEPALLRKVVEQLATRTEFGDKPDAILSRDDFKQLCNMRMVQLSVVVDLAGESRRHCLRYLLNSNPSTRQSVSAQSHFTIRPFKQNGST